MGFVMNSVPELLQHERFSKIISWSQIFPLPQHFIPQQPWIPTTNKTICTLQKKQQGMVLVLTHKRVHSHEETKSNQDEDSGLLRHDAVSLGEGFPLFCWNKWPQLQGLGCQKNAKYKVHRGHIEDQGTTFLQNVGNHLSSDTQLYAWRPESMKKMQWETKMSH